MQLLTRLSYLQFPEVLLRLREIYRKRVYVMCVALPGTVIEVRERTAVVDFSGNQVETRSGLVEVEPGDRVLVHAGMILQKVSQTEVEELEELFCDLEASAAGA